MCVLQYFISHDEILQLSCAYSSEHNRPWHISGILQLIDFFEKFYVLRFIALYTQGMNGLTTSYQVTSTLSSMIKHVKT